MDALDRAIAIAGGQAGLARGISAALPGAREVSQQVVHNWVKRGRVPSEYCPSIEKVTGVQCEDLRPDVDWAYLRATNCPSTASA